SPSGAGKTSLIQAGLLDALEADELWVLPVLRVGREASTGEVAGLSAEDQELVLGANRYLLSALLCLNEALPANLRQSTAKLAQFTSLEAYLATYPSPTGASF